MSTERKEPTISNDAFELTDRVRLTWHEVRELAESADQPPSDPSPSEPEPSLSNSRQL
ncbi:hypothetical protein EVA_11693, partial [gut metagenome]